nr:hypothetical protein [Rhizorhabdus histidinilytica]
MHRLFTGIREVQASKLTEALSGEGVIGPRRVFGGREHPDMMMFALDSAIRPKGAPTRENSLEAGPATARQRRVAVILCDRTCPQICTSIIQGIAIAMVDYDAISNADKASMQGLEPIGAGAIYDALAIATLPQGKRERADEWHIVRIDEAHRSRWQSNLAVVADDNLAAPAPSRLHRSAFPVYLEGAPFGTRAAH